MAMLMVQCAAKDPGAESIHTHDPKFLRQLAATYRARAEAEPNRARVFLEIAGDMEMHATLIECDAIPAHVPVERPSST